MFQLRAIIKFLLRVFVFTNCFYKVITKSESTWHIFKQWLWKNYKVYEDYIEFKIEKTGVLGNKYFSLIIQKTPFYTKDKSNTSATRTKPSNFRKVCHKRSRPILLIKPVVGKFKTSIFVWDKSYQTDISIVLREF